MDSAAHKLLESATYRTLHANSFSRSSSQASLVLTDLLARYIALLTSTCVRYAHHAGRTGLTARDAFEALDELGVSMDELKEYCSSEGKELGRYALLTARRVEDLNEFKAHLAVGRRQDHDDAIPLYYAPHNPPLSDEDQDSAEDAEQSDIEDEEVSMDMPPPQRTSTLGKMREPTRLSPPPLPLSPISNPSSPSRKRPRTSSWQPPPHIPDFLPPFPTTADTTVSPVSPSSPRPTQNEPPPTQIETVKIEKPPLSISQSLTSTSASDYLVQVPYSQSSLSTVAEWHLPSALPAPSAPSRQSRLPTPQTEPALIAAYHHILTHPPPLNTNSANPSRHRVAMALLSQTQTTPRWDPPDTLFSSVAPCPPRVSYIGPTYPTAIGDKTDAKDVKFPSTLPRPVSALERLTPLVSQQSSRIPDLARHVLSPAILSRTSRLTHPAVLHRGTKPLVYGNGIPAPWNANALPSGDAVPSTPIIKSKDAPNGLMNGKGKEAVVQPLIPDARLYATWDYDTKDFRVPLAPSARNRGRMGAAPGGSGFVSLGSRGRSGSKIG